MKLWTPAAAICAIVLFVVALNNDVYAITSPPGWSLWAVVLRKLYSIVAFALLGFLFARASSELGRHSGAWRCALAIGLYSAAIEIGQDFEGSHEGLTWNAIDVACGAFGGALGGLLASLWPTRRPPASQPR